MKLNEKEFVLEVISKTEFIDDYTFNDKKYLVTIWNVRVSVKTLNDYIYSKLPSSDWESDYASREEYDAAYNQCLNDRKQWEDNFKNLLDQADKNIVITQAHAEFFTAIKIEKM